MRETVVLMVSVPPILERIVESAAEGVDDVRVVGKVPNTDSIGAAIQRSNPDVVLLGLDMDAELSEFTEVLFEHPRLRLIGITPDGRDVQACELTPRTSWFGNLSPEELISEIAAPGRLGGR